MNINKNIKLYYIIIKNENNKNIKLYEIITKINMNKLLN